ncbi:hypothetical protein NKH77_50650 [Streptomyces sp. M19]
MAYGPSGPSSRWPSPRPPPWPGRCSSPGGTCSTPGALSPSTDSPPARCSTW